MWPEGPGGRKTSPRTRGQGERDFLGREGGSVGQVAGEGRAWAEELTQDTWKQEHRSQTAQPAPEGCKRGVEVLAGLQPAWDHCAPRLLPGGLHAAGASPCPRPARPSAAEVAPQSHRCPGRRTPASSAGSSTSRGSDALDRSPADLGQWPWDTCSPRTRTKQTSSASEARRPQRSGNAGRPGEPVGSLCRLPQDPLGPQVRPRWPSAQGTLFCWLRITHSVALDLER